MSHEDLDAYLQAQEAGHLDSSGHFTLDIRALAAKWTQYQTQEPALFLFKAVQAAVAAGAPAVDVKLGRGAVRLSFSAELPDISLEDLLAERRVDQVWLRHLSAGLRNAFAQKPQEVQLSWRGERHHWRGATYSVSKEASCKEVTLMVKPSVEHWWNRLVPSGWHGHLHRELTWRCAFAPVPVRLDGRLLNSGDPDSLPGSRFGKVPVTIWEGAWESYRWLEDRTWVSSQAGFCLAPPVLRPAYLYRVGTRSVEGVRENPRLLCSRLIGSELEGRELLYLKNDVSEGGDGGKLDKALKNPDALLLGYTYLPAKGSSVETAVVLPQAEDLLLRSITFPWRRDIFTTSPLACLRADRWMGVRMSPQQESRLFYVQDGLLLDPIKLDTKFAGTTGVVARADVRTDLSGLKAIRVDEVESDVDWLREQEKELVLGLEGALKSVQEAERRRIPQVSREFWRKEFARLHG